MGRRSISLLLLVVALCAAAPVAAQARAKPRCVVPNLKSDTQAAAVKRLKAAHCALGAVKKPSGSGTEIVSTESPKAGSHEKNGDRVKLTMKFKVKATSTVKATTTPAPTPATTTPAAPAPVPPPALIATTPYVTASDTDGKTYVVGSILYSNATAAALIGEPVTFSVIDSTTGQTVGSFAGTSGAAACTIVASLTSSSTVTFTGQASGSYPACALSAVSVPASDSPILSLSFAGDATYAASLTALNTDPPL
jgi:hypothetical protein